MKIDIDKFIVDEQEIDIDGMVERFKEGIILSQNLKSEGMMIRVIAYRRGLEDMLNKLKGGK